jgi:hypothetical protein
MSPRALDLVVAAGVLLLGLVPLAWPGTGPAVVGLLAMLGRVFGAGAAASA